MFCCMCVALAAMVEGMGFGALPTGRAGSVFARRCVGQGVELIELAALPWTATGGS